MRCPNCFSEIANSQGNCPYCGYELGGWNHNYYHTQYTTQQPSGANHTIPQNMYNVPENYPGNTMQMYYYEEMKKREQKNIYFVPVCVGILSGALVFNILLIILLLVVKF